DQLRRAFNSKFLDPKTHVYQGDTQCGYVLALQFGLVPEDQRNGVISNLVDNILIQHSGHLSVGLIGMQWLMQTLTDIGRPEVAWIIATQTTRPSWGYMLSKGATTIWERWDMDTRDPGMNSEALLIQAGNFDAWLYQTLAGINYDPQQPGSKHIIIRPRLLGDLTWVKAHFDSPFGRIVSSWKRHGDSLCSGQISKSCDGKWQTDRKRERSQIDSCRRWRCCIRRECRKIRISVRSIGPGNVK